MLTQRLIVPLAFKTNVVLQLKTIEKNMLALGKNALVDTWPKYTIEIFIELSSQCKTSAVFNAVIYSFRVGIVLL